MDSLPQAERISVGYREIDPDEPETHPGMVITVSGPSDPTSRQTLRLVEQSGVLDFWTDPEEDVYTEDDGEPL